MGGRQTVVVRRRSARAILIDDDGYLVLIRRTRLHVQHFFVTRLASMDLSARNEPEFDDPSRGAYDPGRFDLRGEELTAIDLQPAALKKFILANREALLVEAGLTALPIRA
jgi:hypothetical protein